MVQERKIQEWKNADLLKILYKSLQILSLCVPVGVLYILHLSSERFKRNIYTCLCFFFFVPLHSIQGRREGRVVAVEVEEFVR